MTFDMERFVKEAQNHPIDPNIVLRIAEEHYSSPRVLNDVLRRCSRAWDGERQMLEWSLQNLHNTAFQLMVTNVSDELMIIDGNFFTVIHLMQKFDIRGPEIEENVSVVHLAIMAQEAHAEQADRIRNNRPLVDEEDAYPVVMYRHGHDDDE